jgi:hypothetical protein
LMTPAVDDAGPSVQTIFVRGIGEAKIRTGGWRRGRCIGAFRTRQDGARSASP